MMGGSDFVIELMPHEIDISFIPGYILHTGFSSVSPKELLNFLKSTHLSIIQYKDDLYPDGECFIVNNAVSMLFELEQAAVKIIALRGNFSWYEESLQTCYDIIRQVNAFIPDLKIAVRPSAFKNNMYIDYSKKESFKSIIRERYSKAYALYKESFPNVRINPKYRYK